MRLVVEHLSKDAKKIGLTEEAIQAAAESRLRSAHLYSTESEPDLYINVTVAGADPRLDDCYSDVDQIDDQ